MNENHRHASSSQAFRKDAMLDRLAERFNVAQFVSFAPSSAEPILQYSRLAGFPLNAGFGSIAEAIDALFERSAYGTVNIRSFSETSSQGREFLYAIQSRDEVLEALGRLSMEGSFTIANETIDVSDGGVSGVILDSIVEFLPDDTPRGVEKGGFASLPTQWAEQAFKIVYGVSPDMAEGRNARLEFTIHPFPRGYKQSHVLYWEYGYHSPVGTSTAEVKWPNDFSRMMGDKAYGLLIAHLAGFHVPRTTVIGRRLRPFTFGTDTGSLEVWTRTSPREQMPGKFTTKRGWIDPFALIADEDPQHYLIASVLSQQAVPALWSGAAIEGADGKLYIEGVKGTGDSFMQGTAAPALLPSNVYQSVTSLHRRLNEALGAVRFEWVFDGSIAWLVQLHRGSSPSTGTTIVPGEPKRWQNFRISDGLDALRRTIADLPSETGLILDGPVGLTSHVADLIRKAGIPARIVREASSLINPE